MRQKQRNEIMKEFFIRVKSAFSFTGRDIYLQPLKTLKLICTHNHLGITAQLLKVSLQNNPQINSSVPTAFYCGLIVNT